MNIHLSNFIVVLVESLLLYITFILLQQNDFINITNEDIIVALITNSTSLYFAFYLEPIIRNL